MFLLQKAKKNLCVVLNVQLSHIHRSVGQMLFLHNLFIALSQEKNQFSPNSRWCSFAMSITSYHLLQLIGFLLIYFFIGQKSEKLKEGSVCIPHYKSKRYGGRQTRCGWDLSKHKHLGALWDLELYVDQETQLLLQYPLLSLRTSSLPVIVNF